MHRRMVGLAASIALASGVALYSTAGAQDMADDKSTDIVVIGNNGTEALLTADSLRDAAKAFRKHAPAFAPASTLWFVASGAVEPTPTIWLRAARAGPDGRHATMPLTVDADHRFTVPLDIALTGQWQMRASGRTGGVAVRPLVLTPGSTVDDRRFGDLRLQCRVSIAFARLSFATRALAGALDPCDNKRFGLHAKMPRQVATATIDGRRTLALGKDGWSVAVPLADQSITNEQRLRIT